MEVKELCGEIVFFIKKFWWKKKERKDNRLLYVLVFLILSSFLLLNLERTIYASNDSVQEEDIAQITRYIINHFKLFKKMEDMDWRSFNWSEPPNISGMAKKKKILLKSLHPVHFFDFFLQKATLH